jgi:hypothetical protein
MPRGQPVSSRALGNRGKRAAGRARTGYGTPSHESMPDWPQSGRVIPARSRPGRAGPAQPADGGATARPGRGGAGRPGSRPPPAGGRASPRRAIVRCRGPVSHPARTWPAGIGWDTVRALAAEAGDTGPGQRGHLARVPAAGARGAAGLALGQPARQCGLPAGQEPACGALATAHGAGHAARRPGEPVGVARRPGSARGTDPGPARPKFPPGQ